MIRPCPTLFCIRDKTDVEGAELFVLESIDLKVTNVHYFLIELDGHNAAKDEAVRAHLTARGFVKSAINPMDGCCGGCDCAANTLFENLDFAARKSARPHPAPHHHVDGTGIRCP